MDRNGYEIAPSWVEIPITLGRKVLLDESDLHLVSAFRWYACTRPHTTYAKATIAGKTVAMHQILLPPPHGMVVDHINRDGLDNRRSNLRLATYSQSCANRKLKNIRQYRGVRPHRSKYAATISISGKLVHLGTFQSPEDAARAYDRACLAHFGWFGILNFPESANG